MKEVEFETVKHIRLKAGDCDVRKGDSVVQTVPAVVFEVDFEAYGLIRFAAPVDEAMELAVGITGAARKSVTDHMQRQKEN